MPKIKCSNCGALMVPYKQDAAGLCPKCHRKAARDKAVEPVEPETPPDPETTTP